MQILATDDMTLARPPSSAPGVTGIDGPESKDAIRHLAREFEAVLASAMLKEGLVSARDEGDEEGGSGSGTYMDIAYEQIAYHIGKQGILGIADDIVRNMNQSAEASSHGN